MKKVGLWHVVILELEKGSWIGWLEFVTLSVEKLLGLVWGVPCFQVHGGQFMKRFAMARTRKELG